MNEQGCYLANYKTGRSQSNYNRELDDYTSDDGGFFPVYVDSYWPNDYGLYNVIGNVSEMLQVKGIARGGNWDMAPEDAVLTSEQTYSGADPRIGFRVFMEVIEY